MITLHWYDEQYTGDIAVKGYDYVALYDENYNETQRIISVFGREWNHISIEGGEWTDPSVIPTIEDHLRADIDYLTMMNEDLTKQNEQARADIDYLLMMLEEESIKEPILKATNENDDTQHTLF